MTVALVESAAPAAFDTRTQNTVVVPSAGVYVADVAPSTGAEVVPLLPMYHWIGQSGRNPVATTLSSAERPASTDWLCGLRGDLRAPLTQARSSR